MGGYLIIVPIVTHIVMGIILKVEGVNRGHLILKDMQYSL
jgi:hypothetical protein